jgi:hypothetical protein
VLFIYVILPLLKYRQIINIFFINKEENYYEIIIINITWQPIKKLTRFISATNYYSFLKKNDICNEN